MPQRQTLEEMVMDRYDDQEIASAVLDDIAKHGTEEMILDGRSVLPHPTDAQHWHARITGKQQMTPTERSQAAIIKAQDERLATLEAQVKGLMPAAPQGGQ